VLGAPVNHGWEEICSLTDTSMCGMRPGYLRSSRLRKTLVAKRNCNQNLNTNGLSKDRFTRDSADPALRARVQLQFNFMATGSHILHTRTRRSCVVTSQVIEDLRSLSAGVMAPQISHIGETMVSSTIYRRKTTCLKLNELWQLPVV
jgi:hypothetical protein